MSVLISPGDLIAPKATGWSPQSATRHAHAPCSNCGEVLNAAQDIRILYHHAACLTVDASSKRALSVVEEKFRQSGIESVSPVYCAMVLATLT
jgi:hypothetical protein